MKALLLIAVLTPAFVGPLVVLHEQQERMDALEAKLGALEWGGESGGVWEQEEQVQFIDPSELQAAYYLYP